MKYLDLYIFVILLLVLTGTIHSDEIYFGQKNTLETQGTITFNTKYYNSKQIYDLNFALGGKYFFKNHFYWGLTPNVIFRFKKQSHNTMYYCEVIPFLSIGYVKQVSDKLYYGVAPEIGLYSFFGEDDGNRKTYYGFNNYIKYLLGTKSTISLEIKTYYVDYSKNTYYDDFLNIQLYLGYSLWFNLK